MSALRAPESWPLTVRSEISQEITRHPGGNFRADQKKNLCAWRSGALAATTPLTAFIQSNSH
ncbi:MAG TPA: hypothetical protein VKY24_13500 [Reyranella sp.]|nr:hypothetical protein [Reyranella sp.]